MTRFEHDADPYDVDPYEASAYELAATLEREQITGEASQALVTEKGKKGSPLGAALGCIAAVIAGPIAGIAAMRYAQVRGYPQYATLALCCATATVACSCVFFGAKLRFSSSPADPS